jgi:hypothetical protein
MFDTHDHHVTQHHRPAVLCHYWSCLSLNFSLLFRTISERFKFTLKAIMAIVNTIFKNLNTIIKWQHKLGLLLWL